MTHTHTNTVRIFEDVGGYYYSDASLATLDTRGRSFPTVAACVRYLRDSNALRDVPFTHYVRGERVRSIQGAVR